MNRLALNVAALIFGAAIASPASADVFTFNYSGFLGSSATGTFTTAASTTPGSFLITSISNATFDGTSITGLSLPGTYPMFGSNDNILIYPSSPNYLDANGFSFSTATDEVNIFLGGLGYSDSDRVNATGATSSDFLGTFTVTPVIAAVPEPSTWAMMILGFCGLGFMAYRRKQSGTASVAA